MHSDSNEHPGDEALSLYCSGRSDATTAATVGQHLAECATCRARLAALFAGSAADAPSAVTGTASACGTAASVPTGSPNATSTSSIIPSELTASGRYVDITELGRGGMGIVYRARDTMMDRLVVLKVVHKELLARSGASDRFLREIRSAARLQHPNVVTAYSADWLGDTLAFVMEYAPGDDLAKVVRTHGSVPVRAACYYAHQVALGLQHAHEKGMVHRDIKPSNLVLTRDGKKALIKILDFGLAKIVSEKGLDTGSTGDGAMLGTPDYMAPEQAMDAGRADIRADIYALGCTLYCLLSGGPPFRGSSLLELLQHHQSTVARPLHEVQQDVPAELSAVVAVMMAKKPEDRPQTPADVARALAPFVRAAPTASRVEPAIIEAAETQPPVANTITGSAQTLVAPDTKPVGEVWSSLEPAVPIALPDDDEAESSRTIKTKNSKPWFWPAVAIGVLVIGSVGIWAISGLMATAADGTLVVDANEPAAEVLIDGQVVAVTWDTNHHAELKLKPGKHTVEVRKSGFTTFGDNIAIVSGERKELVAKLVRSTAGKSGDKGGDNSAKGLVIITQPEHTFTPPGLSRWLVSHCVTPDGKYVLAGGDRVHIKLAVNTPLRMYEIATGQEVKTLPGNTCRIASIAVGPRGRVAASVTGGGPFGKQLRVWNLASGQQTHEFALPMGIGESDVAFNGRGEVLLCVQSEVVRKWDIGMGREVHTMVAKAHEKGGRGKRDVRCVRFSADRERVLTGLSNGTIVEWEVATGRDLNRYVGHITPIRDIYAAPDRKHIVSCSEGATLKVWEVEKTFPKLSIEVGAEPTAVSMSADGLFAVAGCENGEVRVFSASTGNECVRYRGHTAEITSVSFTPDGKRVISCGKDNALRIWKFES